MIEGFTETAESLIAAAANFYQRGWVLGTSGNFSAVMSRAPLRLAITPSGADKGALRPEQILLIDEHLNVINQSAAKPSDESPLHVRVVQERGAGAVMHTHSIWSTMLSDVHFERHGLEIEGFEMLKGLAGVTTHEHREWLPILENSQDMARLAGEVAVTLTEHPNAHGFLLRKHGLYTWGKNLGEARRHVEILEFLLESIGRRS